MGSERWLSDWLREGSAVYASGLFDEEQGRRTLSALRQAPPRTLQLGEDQPLPSGEGQIGEPWLGAPRVVRVVDEPTAQLRKPHDARLEVALGDGRGGRAHRGPRAGRSARAIAGPKAAATPTPTVASVTGISTTKGKAYTHATSAEMSL